MYKRIEVGGKEYHLRIRAQHVQELHEMLNKKPIPGCDHGQHR